MSSLLSAPVNRSASGVINTPDIGPLNRMIHVLMFKYFFRKCLLTTGCPQPKILLSVMIKGGSCV